MDRLTDYEFGTGVDWRRTSGMAADVGESAYNSSQHAMTAIVHVTPELQPMIGGIADYAAILGRAMSEREIRQHYLVASYAALAYQQCIRASSLEALVLDSTTSNDLLRGLRDLEAETVLLHYSGYGYAPRGAPFWLVEGLGRWKKLRAHHRLIVMFHETWASGLPWQSSFWLSPLQRWCVARIARLADAVVTNTSYYRARLEPLFALGRRFKFSQSSQTLANLMPFPPLTSVSPSASCLGAASRDAGHMSGLGDISMSYARWASNA